MSEPKEQLVDEVLSSVYSPLKGIEQLLGEFLCALHEKWRYEFTIYLEESSGGLNQLHLAVTNLCNNFVNGICRSCPLISGHPPAPGQNSILEGFGAFHNACQMHPAPCNLNLSVPIRYQRDIMGLISYRGEPSLEEAGRIIGLSQLIARRVAYLGKRFELNQYTKKQLGRDLWLIGASRDSLISLNGFIEKASQVSLPVMIFAEAGSEREDVAYAIHLLSSRREGPFITFDCSTFNSTNFSEEFIHWLNMASSGTIFLMAVDALEYRLQIELVDYIKSELGGVDVRLIASANLVSGVLVRMLIPSLLGELSFLSERIEPLRNRSSDIRHLASFFLHHSSGGRTDLSTEAMAVFESYSWPGNVDELRTVATRLATRVRGSSVTLEDIDSHAPHLIEGESWAGPSGSQSEEPRQPVRPGTPFSLAKLCKVGITEQNKRMLHPAVVKAILYLLGNLESKVSLGKLAQHACVSPSHLSWLFNQVVGTSPIAFLTLLRIEKSKALLIKERALTITEIASRSGFGDLRHFERMFKRSVQMSPRQFRAEAA